jgi:CRISPR-associated endonuclease/helicase Cas3
MFVATKTTPLFFIGKTNPEQGTAHPLSHHCLDVAAVLRQTLNIPLIRQRCAAAAHLPDLTDVQCDRLAVLALLHDLGKFSTGFQYKLWSLLDPTLPKPKFAVRTASGKVSLGHSLEAASLFYHVNCDTTLARLPFAIWSQDWFGKDILDDPEDFLGILFASIAHHGQSVFRFDALSKNGCAIQHAQNLWLPWQGLDPWEGMTTLLADARRWFPNAFAAAGDPVHILPATPDFQHMFAGLVMFADWLGSTTHFGTPGTGTCTELFRYSASCAEDRYDVLLHPTHGIAKRALREIGMVSDARGVLAGTESFTLQHLGLPGAAALSAVQARVQTAPVPDAGESSLLLIESETGSGKTEAALLRFLRLYQAGRVDGLYFALPTRAAALQIQRRLHTAMQHVFGTDAPPVTLAVPGYIRFDTEDGRRLPDFHVLYDDSDAPAGRGWSAEHPKRYFAGPIVIGTIDQALMSVLKVKHAQMRAALLSRHLLILDEIHATDTYMTVLVEELVRRHRRLGGHIVLMSATLGSAARTHFFNATKPGESIAIPDFAAAAATPYPLLSYQQGNSPQDAWTACQHTCKEVQIHLQPLAADPQAIAALALDAAQQGAKVLIIRNTVDRLLLPLQMALETEAQRRGRADLLFACGGQPVPHHSRYAAADRKMLDQRVEDVFGKSSSRGQGIVLVATQTVEQSLDIDADLLFTDLCPMDVLLQRMGRLHRHAHRNTRPAGFSAAQCVILTSADRDLGKQAAAGRYDVYQNVPAIEATWRMLEQHTLLSIPGMNRQLVESVVHPDRIDAIVQEQGWDTAHVKGIGKTASARQEARHALFQLENGFTSEKLCMDDAEGRRVSTRLSEDENLVIAFEASVVSPLSQEGIDTLKIRQDWVFSEKQTDASEQSKLNPVILENTGNRIVFSFANLQASDQNNFIYDRLGLRKIAS